MLLAIDTATRTASVALYDGRYVVGETSWRTHENHTRSLIPEVIRLFEVCRVEPPDLKAVGVSLGPGSFTGLRIGLSAAKGLATSLGLALVGVPTLEVSASELTWAGMPIWAVLEAGRGRFAGALFVEQEGELRRTSDHFFGTAEGMVEHISARFPDLFRVDDADGDSTARRAGRSLIGGELDERLASLVRAKLGDRVLIAHGCVEVRRAGSLAKLAWRRLARGQRDDVETLAPFYIPTAALS